MWLGKARQRHLHLGSKLLNGCWAGGPGARPARASISASAAQLLVLRRQAHASPFSLLEGPSMASSSPTHHPCFHNNDRYLLRRMSKMTFSKGELPTCFPLHSSSPQAHTAENPLPLGPHSIRRRWGGSFSDGGMGSGAGCAYCVCPCTGPDPLPGQKTVVLSSSPSDVSSKPTGCWPIPPTM